MEPIINDPLKPREPNGKGKAYAINPSGGLVLIKPDALKPGWRWATEGDIKAAEAKAAGNVQSPEEKQIAEGLARMAEKAAKQPQSVLAPAEVEIEVSE